MPSYLTTGPIWHFRWLLWALSSQAGKTPSCGESTALLGLSPRHWAPIHGKKEPSNLLYWWVLCTAMCVFCLWCTSKQSGSIISVPSHQGTEDSQRSSLSPSCTQAAQMHFLLLRLPHALLTCPRDLSGLCWICSMGLVSVLSLT